ncbi:MAG TPA: serine/threonine-protein kinase [Candidatus Nitrosotalea sp.]|nr:serine/threonine-protein kinase [Candidatus Nitrosotalea sp.]
MSIAPGTQLGPYLVQDLIGLGAMGQVYRAWHGALERPAAVKILQALAPDADAAARFRREARSIAGMRHPNILSVFDYGELDGVPYMVVEFMPGGNLAGRSRGANGPMAPPDAIALLRPLASALDYAHALGVVHRDVKPANILLAADGAPVLADFGLAKLLQSSTLATATGVTTGTPAYMAPEQVLGDEVGPAADRYALAAVAYELLSGRLPFEGAGVMEVLYAQVHRPPPPASAHRPELGQGVDQVLMAGLAKDPAQRPASCVEFVNGLERALAQPDTPAPLAIASTQRVTPQSVAGVGPRRQIAPWVVGVILLLALAGGLGMLRHLRLAAANSPLATPRMTLSAARVGPGGSLVVSATGLKPGQSGQVSMDSGGLVVLGLFSASATGSMRTTVVIPPGAAVGEHLLEVCWNQTCPLSQVLQVTGTGSGLSGLKPQILLGNPNPRLGTTLRVLGTGFTPGSPYTVVLRQGDVTIEGHPGSVGAGGGWQSTIGVPSSRLVAGPATVMACQNPVSGPSACASGSLTIRA